MAVTSSSPDGYVTVDAELRVVSAGKTVTTNAYEVGTGATFGLYDLPFHNGGSGVTYALNVRVDPRTSVTHVYGSTAAPIKITVSEE